MSSLSLKIPHSLSKEEALSRIKNLIGNMKEEHKSTISNVQETWDGEKGNFSFSAQGFALSGDIKVNDSEIEIHSQLPFAVSLFKSQIASMITNKAKELLS